MKITEHTTLAQLEEQLRTFGLMLTVSFNRYGYAMAIVTDPVAVSGGARGASIAEAVNGALEEYKTQKVGPQ